MSNRHERRRASKIGSVSMLNMSDMKKMISGCAWSGCACSTSDPDKDGWSKLLLYRGTTKPNFMDISPNKMDRDAVLCPEHAKTLHEDVLFNLSRLSNLFNAEPAGTA